MADVTFGVKVSEEMKNELSLLMKEHTLSGKEFMSMLLASYQLDKARENSSLYESDIVELQNLTKRIHSIFINMTEKSKLNYKEEQEALQKVIEAQKEEKEQLLQKNQQSEEIVKKLQLDLNKQKEEEAALKEEITKSKKAFDILKKQSENNMLLHDKFKEEVELLKEQLNQYKRLDLEVQERNEEISKLKARNDETASEIWFLKREIEKLQLEKEQLIEKHETEVKSQEKQQQLILTNKLLEQSLEFSKKIDELKEALNHEKEEKNKLEKAFYEKIERLYTNSKINTTLDK